MKGFLNTKKIIALGLALTFTVSLTGCGKKDVAGNTTSNATPTPTTVASGTTVPTIPESQKVTPPPIVINDSSAKDKKLSSAEKEQRKKIAAFTEALANDKRLVGSTVTVHEDIVTAALTVKSEISDSDAKAVATEYATKMKPLYNKKVKVVILKGANTVAETSL